jgi:hypothetical protein
MTPTLLINNVYAVEVPEGADNIRVSQLIGTPKLFADIPGYLYAAKLPPGSWKLIGTIKEVTEDVAKGIVERTHAGGFGRSGEEFKNYIKPSPVCFTALDSLNSLLASKNLDTNKNWVMVRKG